METATRARAARVSRLEKWIACHVKGTPIEHSTGTFGDVNAIRHEVEPAASKAARSGRAWSQPLFDGRHIMLNNTYNT